ncbi:hypothetical protein CLV70_14024 [Pseudosporangium ferrugineum]|uniref:Uncharacterized protein n=1 Tax=Pseudosporangium ferrugineum TaxID=439699 RepID=A0A2T0RCW2_9ACTN|nr:hypothetical protein CLV70_14024 [Pseudosporangium ferrugineum]
MRLPIAGDGAGPAVPPIDGLDQLPLDPMVCTTQAAAVVSRSRS